MFGTRGVGPDLRSIIDNNNALDCLLSASATLLLLSYLPDPYLDRHHARGGPDKIGNAEDRSVRCLSRHKTSGSN